MEYTEKQKTTFKALKQILHLNYIVRNYSEQIFGFINKPEKNRLYWSAWDWIDEDEGVILTSIDKDVFKFVQWKDKEPFEIPDIQ